MLQTETAPMRISILGATGSIGTSTIDLVRRAPKRYAVQAISANSNASGLAQIARELRAGFAAVADPKAYRALKAELSGSGIEAAAGPEAVSEAGARDADWVMAAISGASGLEPTLAAVKRGRKVALANKECLVCAGTLFMRTAAEHGATILPADSEHNAIAQAMGAGSREDVRKITVTASGGPFRTFTKEQLKAVTREQALKHPNYAMGAKITVDSSTMMNKGLELIEAHHLFDAPPEMLDAVVHPQQAIHGMVEFRDGSLVAAMATPDMRLPIAHCLAWPDRITDAAEPLDLARIGTLTFETPDTDRFPCLKLARQAMEAGKGAPTVLNAANEIAVAAFLAGGLSYLGIPLLVAAALDAAAQRGLMHEPSSVSDALEIDRAARSLAAELLPEIAAKSS
ncbi:1-deoxy-D-xylulose 5-phosphate reductoisomerase [Variibacter gotjawalensis]|uniref:1-deoxy-D-xylulose 5-phosphate reductoisomerase n=1 Tax=Variibacter gotjawalensis TaxID=1333996 RepID=A0A0S3PWF6_9BRAD|nr:1-deoxy-D-xylulose-5-phosphate reductoisomerase [Variibacter gotjawalensis]NIK46103.1 1-deoxy-D-xylulose-5-phosphate reductoisomerase [Variibacter gotjawalensis]RZS48021.1 1-deoxy-D-xylulose 5-phosphate reductoisomerase [Variibacter gotjawalensis]BAT60277.1 1-deoxy-D-xylulose 5-phosphate reductoisomerase [Variibacter gotjawalensis]